MIVRRCGDSLEGYRFSKVSLIDKYQPTKIFGVAIGGHRVLPEIALGPWMSDTIGQSAPGMADFAGSPLAGLMELLHSSEAGLRASDATAVLKTVGPNRIDAAKPSLADGVDRTIQQPTRFDFALRCSGIGVHRRSSKLPHHHDHRARLGHS